MFVLFVCVHSRKSETPPHVPQSLPHKTPTQTAHIITLRPRNHTRASGEALVRATRTMDAGLLLHTEPPTPPSPHSCARQRIHALLMTAAVAVTKIFLGGFCWQAGSLATRQPSTSVVYALAAGAGDAAGTFIGNALLIACLSCLNGWPGWRHLITSGLVVSTGSLFSGTIWQPLVNRFSRLGLTFNAGMLCTGSICGAVFFIGITAAAFASLRLAGTAFHRPWSDIVKDASLSVAVCGATACFVGTDMSWHGNWLQRLVGERDHSSPSLDCVKAGFSTLIGFGAIQILLVALVPSRFMWTTPDAPERATIVVAAAASASADATDAFAERPPPQPVRRALATMWTMTPHAYRHTYHLDQSDSGNAVWGPSASRSTRPGTT
jgi:hypothetical protein